MNIQLPHEITADRDQLLTQHCDKEMLRFITCGSVDDGKSTLIGRLLIEAGAVYEDQLSALKADSARHGTTGEEIDAALLVDGLEDERQQGITIDVAYRYFATAKRKFIIADTPGHEQFTRNMATGASTADLAIILVDARNGIVTQTKRHAFIVSLMGIRHIVLAINKMDLVDYQQSVFDAIKDQFVSFAEKLDLTDVRFVPVSALRGDNIAEPSSKMLWYDGTSLLHLLESIYVGSDRNLQDLRFPVQIVNRPDLTYRGICGTVASGTVRVGDDVMVLPSRKRTTIKQIVTASGDLQEAVAGRSVSLVLNDELDVTRGDLLARPGNQPTIASQADAILVWMSEQGMVPGKRYWIKHTTHKATAEITSLHYSINVNTLHRSPASTLQLNEIGRCQLQFSEPFMFDDYRRNRQTGAFILVDRLTHETVAGGMFIARGHQGTPADIWEHEPAGYQLRRAESLISGEQRREQYGYAPFTVLITGLSGSGKTTTALMLEKRLFELKYPSLILDGQNMRFGISRDLGFSSEERSENLRRAAEVAKLINDAGQICIAAFVAPHADARDKARKVIGTERLLHVHLSTPLEICRARDESQRYLAADRGEITDFPGVTRAYEQPQEADLVISAESLTTAEIVDAVVGQLAKWGVVG